MKAEIVLTTDPEACHQCKTCPFHPETCWRNVTDTDHCRRYGMLHMLGGSHYAPGAGPVTFDYDAHVQLDPLVHSLRYIHGDRPWVEDEQGRRRPMTYGTLRMPNDIVIRGRSIPTYR